jgi:hypothetical protein
MRICARSNMRLESTRLRSERDARARKKRLPGRGSRKPDGQSKTKATIERVLHQLSVIRQVGLAIVITLLVQSTTKRWLAERLALAGEGG